jgi:predicted MFS family arabinose efflux permease
MFGGVLTWSVAAGVYLAMVAGIALWGLGFAAANSMQQARLIATAPALGGASVALNTSALYVGQAIGSAIGGAMFAAGHFLAMGYVASVFLLAALGILLMTRRPAANS